MKKLTIIFILTISGLSAYPQLEISAELRPRAELRYGYKQLPVPGSDPAVFVSQRTRLNLSYEHDRLQLGFSIQDVRVWGDEQIFSSTGVYGDNASLDLKEGWIGLSAGKSHTLKIGRQILKYDDERLLAIRNWNQISISYDAFLYKFKQEKFMIDVCLSFNNNSENIFGNDYNLYSEELSFDTLAQILKIKKVPMIPRLKSINFIHISKEFGMSQISFIALVSALQNPKSNNTNYVKGTYGTHYKFENKSWFARGSVYFQHGSNVQGQSVEAWMVNVFGKYMLNRISLDAGIDIISGQDGLKTDPDYRVKDHFFDIFYGARHRYYGLMDYFSNMSPATRNGGLVDICAGFGYKLTSKISSQLDYHFFKTQSRVEDPDQPGVALKKALGSEIDLTLNLILMESVNLEGGFSFLLPGASMEKIQGIVPGSSPFAYWGWLMLTVKPVLFNSEK